MVRQSERREMTIAAILKAARVLFAERGFLQTSIDDIAAEAGVAKGAVYHHFASKEDILLRLVNDMQAEIAAQIPEAARGGKDMMDGLMRGTLKYLTAITMPGTKQILLVDGPAILGWEKWREIDQYYFSGLMRGPLSAALRNRLSTRQIEALEHLIAGAMMEAALVCAASSTPRRTSREMAQAMRTLLAPLLMPQ